MDITVIAWCRNLGEGQQVLRSTFELARASAPSCIVIDDIDTICGMRSSYDEGSCMPILSTLLVELDGIEERQGTVPLLLASPEDLSLFEYVGPLSLDHLHIFHILYNFTQIPPKMQRR